MSSQPPQLPVITLADPPSQRYNAAVPEVTSLSINGGGDTLSPFATSTSEKYSIVQPGVLLTELQRELDGVLTKSEPVLLRGGCADIYKGQWTRPDGETIDVAIKELRVATPSSITTDREKLRRKIDIVGPDLGISGIRLMNMSLIGWQRLKRETLIWTRAKHPNIHIFLGFRWTHEPQLISPWCSQGNLHDYLTLNGSLSRNRKLKLIEQVALGLAYLHAQKPPICHGDIKLENILINDSLDAVISDFGVSRVLDSLAEHTGLSTSGSGVKGTYRYSAPELLDLTLLGEELSEVKHSCESDVYAFGGLILAVMSRQVPFYRVRNETAIMRKIMKGETPKPEDHDLLAENDPLWSVMNSCWEFDPSDRSSMNDVLEMMKRDGAL